MTVAFTDAGPVFRGRANDAGIPAAFAASFVGANAVRPAAVDPSPAQMHYYRGADSSKWVSGVPSFGAVEYKGLYDGVDLRVSGTRSRA